LAIQRRERRELRKGTRILKSFVSIRESCTERVEVFAAEVLDLPLKAAESDM
jgi:hypothetical protein